MCFGTRENPYPTTELKEQLSSKYNVEFNSVTKWFVNRRVKERGIQANENVAIPEEKKLRTRKVRKTSIEPVPSQNLANQDETLQSPNNQNLVTNTSETNVVSATEVIQTQSKEQILAELELEIKPKLKKQINPNSPPLWKQLLLTTELVTQKPTKTNDKCVKQEQALLNHILNTRTEQELAPFFAMITGPTIRPYRMEELEIIIGRNSYSLRVRIGKILFCGLETISLRNFVC